jgi:alpha-beta hydrolase superfamily lysophospholipase
LDDGELPSEQRWEWEGIAVHVDRYERPDAPLTVIGLHGGGGYGRLLAPVGLLASRLGYEAVLPDLPGYGLTRVPRRRFTYPTWVACARDLATAEYERTDKPVIAVGASMGGMLAWHAAAAGAPLIGIVATTLIDPRDPEVLASIGRNRWVGRFGARLLRIAPVLTDPLPVPMAVAANMSAIANDPAVARLARGDKLGGGKMVPARFLRTWADYTPAGEPEVSHVPVLLAHPAADRWTPTELSERFLRRLAGPTQLVTLENCGHFPLEEPGLTQLEAAIANFAAKVGSC